MPSRYFPHDDRPREGGPSRARRHLAVAREHHADYDDGRQDTPTDPPVAPHPTDSGHDASDDRPVMPPAAPHPADAPDADLCSEAMPAVAAGGPQDRLDDDAGLDAAVVQVRRAVEGLLDRATDPGSAGGELSALLGLLSALDLGHAAAVELTDAALRRNSAQRSAGLPLEGLLAMASRQTYTDRNTLMRVTETLRSMPNLKAAWQAGRLGWGQVTVITSEAARLDATARAELDSRLADTDRWARWDPDHLVGVIRDTAASLRPERAEHDRELRHIERRFHHIQPQLDGAITGYYELDSEAGSIWLEALHAASPPPTGTRDATRDAIDRDHHDGHDGDDGDDGDRDGGLPAFADLSGGRTRARQRADAMVTLAEGWLAGTRTDGTPRRARTRTLVWTDIDQLTGTDRSARAARMLWATIGAPATLTAAAASRLASDTDLQFIIHHDGEVIGVSEPTPTIPARVRAAVHARDQGCRFPGCTVPIHWTDLHHIIAREHGGPTTVVNLVALCRRHHTVVTNRAWQLTMSPDGTVTVRRGTRTATTDPPHRRTLPAA